MSPAEAFAAALRDTAEAIRRMPAEVTAWCRNLHRPCVPDDMAQGPVCKRCKGTPEWPCDEWVRLNAEVQRLSEPRAGV